MEGVAVFRGQVGGGEICRLKQLLWQSLFSGVHPAGKGVDGAEDAHGL